MPEDTRWTGIYRHGNGWRAEVSVGRGRTIRRHFEKDATPAEMQEWREDQRAKHRLERKRRAFAGTFEADAAKYLKSVIALPTYKERVKEIAAWVKIFGTKRRDEIGPSEIRAVRDRWLTEPRAPRPREKNPSTAPLAPGTVNKRLRALSNLFTVLDGRDGSNPVRDVPEAREPDPEPKAIDYDTIRTILAALPDIGRAPRGKKRPALSLTKLRLSCLAFCPITPKQLATITAADLDLERARLRLPSRRKGRGAAAIWTHLVPEAVDAFNAFAAANAFGPFSQSSVRKSWRRAIAAAGVTVPDRRVYSLRHSFGTLAYRATGSLEAVAKLMQHRSTRTTERYALGAEQEVLAAHARVVGEQFGVRGDAQVKKTGENWRQSPATPRPRPAKARLRKPQFRPENID